jgi:hypothetical protein
VVAHQSVSHATDARLLDRYTRIGVGVAVAPLLPWGAVHVFLLAAATGIPSWVAWIPALSTTGVMIASTRLALQHKLDRRTRALAKYLSWFAITLDALVSGIYHILPAHLTPNPAVIFTVAILPAIMGGLLWHIRSAAGAQESRMAAEAAEAATAAQAAAAELDAQRQALALQAEADEQRRIANLNHEQQIANIRSQAAQAAEREQAAHKRVAAAITAPSKPTLVPPAPAGPVDALGRPAKASPKRDKALRYLLDQVVRLDDVTAAEVDRHIGSTGYARKYLTDWKDGVRAHVADKGAA